MVIVQTQETLLLSKQSWKKKKAPPNKLGPETVIAALFLDTCMIREAKRGHECQSGTWTEQFLPVHGKYHSKICHPKKSPLDPLENIFRSGVGMKRRWGRKTVF